MRSRATQRFDAAILVAVTLVVIGGVFGNSALFVAATVPICYLFVAAITRSPSADGLELGRSFDPEVAPPGQPTTVTVTVHNDSNRTLSDVRIVDGVPEQLPVVDGSPRGCLSVRPGETESISYEVLASQGDYEFEPPVVRLRPLSGGSETTGRVSTGGSDVLRCRRTVGEVPNVIGALRRVGTEPTDSPGNGLEFHSVRTYRPGDSRNRINWRRLAKTGTLSTVNFQETRATRTVLVVDARSPTRVAAAEGHPTAAELSAYAADLVFSRLVAEGNQAGMTALGVPGDDVAVPVPTDRSGHPWVDPGNSPAVRDRIEAVLDSVVAKGKEGPAENWAATDGGQSADTLTMRQQLPDQAEVVFTTPALDDEPVELVSALVAAGHRVLVVSPDVTGDRSPGSHLAGVKRSVRIQQLRASGATVIDWETTDPLALALEEAT